MKKILVVDDSITSRALFRAYVPDDGTFEVYEAGDYRAAVDVAKEVSPDLCVMDYNMPEKNGIEIAEAIMAAGIDSKFMLMTANVQKNILDRAKKLGFIALIEKPLDPERVSHILRGAL